MKVVFQLIVYVILYDASVLNIISIQGFDYKFVDPCENNGHLTDPEFTCCANKKYDPPDLYKGMARCFQIVEKEDMKIVQSAWTNFQCLVTAAFGDELTLEKFTEKMSSNLPADIQKQIKAAQEEIEFENYTLPYEDLQPLLGDFEEVATIWNIYYTAEHLACTQKIPKKDEKEKLDLNFRCFNALERTMRRGDCCDGVPIPFQLHSAPIVLKYFALKNYTAVNLMTLMGPDYKWQNSSVVQNSDTISACKKTMELVLQGKITLGQLEKQAKDQTPPNYEEIAEMMVPKFVSRATRKFFMDEMLRVDNTTKRGLQFDDTIMNMMNPNSSIYQYAYNGDWGKKGLNETSTRYLLWTCRAHVLLDQLYKNVDYSEECF